MTYTPYQSPPGVWGQPPQQPRKRWIARHKVLTALGLLATLIIVIAIAASAGGGGTAPKNTGPIGTGGKHAPASHAPVRHRATVPSIGTPVRDGQFQFTVTSVTHVKSVNDPVLGPLDTANGEYTVLHVTIKNISSTSQIIDDSSQFVSDAQGRQFDANTSADIDGNPSNGVFLNDLNPGTSVSGKLYFDLPTGDKATSAQLHDSLFSGGVNVSLKR